MKSSEIISYCLDNYGYIEHKHNHYGEELSYNQNGKSYAFLTIKEFDTDDDNISHLNEAGRFRLSLKLKKDDYDKLFSIHSPYSKKYISYKNCDFTLSNIIMPHPFKSSEYYISCISPKRDVFENVLKHLISLSYKNARSEYLKEK